MRANPCFRNLDLYRNMGQKIRDYREDIDWTQIRLAQELGVSHDVVSKIELGKSRPDVMIIFAIASILDEKFRAKTGRRVRLENLIPDGNNPIEAAWSMLRNAA